MNYSLLPREQWDRLIPIYKEMGGVPPKEDFYARVVVAEDAGKIVGNSSLQSVLCIEATRVEESYSGKVGFRSLHRELIRSLPHGIPYFAFAINPKMQRICEYVHMERMNWAVYKGVS